MPSVDKEPTTHYRGCWRVHHGCAIAKIEELQTLLAERWEDRWALTLGELGFYARLRELLAESDKEAAKWTMLREHFER